MNHPAAIHIVYRVEVDSLIVEAITVGDSHEYRILKDGQVLIQTNDGYGQPGIALRDGLVKATDPLWIF